MICMMLLVLVENMLVLVVQHKIRFPQQVTAKMNLGELIVLGYIPLQALVPPRLYIDIRKKKIESF